MKKIILILLLLSNNLYAKSDIEKINIANILISAMSKNNENCVLSGVPTDFDQVTADYFQGSGLNVVLKCLNTYEVFFSVVDHTNKVEGFKVTALGVIQYSGKISNGQLTLTKNFADEPAD